MCLAALLKPLRVEILGRGNGSRYHKPIWYYGRSEPTLCSVSLLGSCLLVAERPVTECFVKGHHSFCSFFVSACPPEPSHESQHAAGCFGGRERKEEAYLGRACSLLYPQGAVRAILCCLLLFPCLLPPLLPPQVSIPISVQAVHACGEHIKTICEAAWQLDKCKHGLEVFI